jgi:helix-turn-helix protein
MTPASAFDKLKEHPEYATVQVKIYDALGKLKQHFGSELRQLTADRFKAELGKMYLHAKAYLTLVDDQSYQDAYVEVLEYLGRIAWEEYSGMDYEFASRGDLVPIRDLVNHWRAEGYRRLASLKREPKSNPASEVSVQSAPESKPAKLRAVREPRPELFTAETLNRKASAIALGISERTLDRWTSDGTLTPMGHGSRKRFKCKDLQKLLTQKQQDKVDRK